MKIKEELVIEVVTEASKKMSDPNYSAVLVGGFVQSQAAAARYLSAAEKDLGGAEAVVNTIFHSALMAECFKRSNNQTIPELSFADLDRVSDLDREKELGQRQPSLLEYIKQNIESDSMSKTLMLLALAMDKVA